MVRSAHGWRVITKSALRYNANVAIIMKRAILHLVDDRVDHAAFRVTKNFDGHGRNLREYVVFGSTVLGSTVTCGTGVFGEEAVFRCERPGGKEKPRNQGRLRHIDQGAQQHRTWPDALVWGEGPNAAISAQGPEGLGWSVVEGQQPDVDRS